MKLLNSNYSVIRHFLRLCVLASLKAWIERSSNTFSWVRVSTETLFNSHWFLSTDTLKSGFIATAECTSVLWTKMPLISHNVQKLKLSDMDGIAWVAYLGGPIQASIQLVLPVLSVSCRRCNKEVSNCIFCLFLHFNISLFIQSSVSPRLWHSATSPSELFFS